MVIHRKFEENDGHVGNSNFEPNWKCWPQIFSWSIIILLHGNLQHLGDLFWVTFFVSPLFISPSKEWQTLLNKKFTFLKMILHVLGICKRTWQVNPLRSKSGIIDFYSQAVHTPFNQTTKILLQETTDFPEQLSLFSWLKLHVSHLTHIMSQALISCSCSSSTWANNLSSADASRTIDYLLTCYPKYHEDAPNRALLEVIL